MILVLSFMSVEFGLSPKMEDHKLMVCQQGAEDLRIYLDLRGRK
jgi:hypothetical protein